MCGIYGFTSSAWKICNGRATTATTSSMAGSPSTRSSCARRRHGDSRGLIAAADGLEMVLGVDGDLYIVADGSGAFAHQLDIALRFPFEPPSPARYTAR